MTEAANEHLSLVQTVEALPVNAPDAWFRSRRERYAYVGVRNAMVRLATHGNGVAVVTRLGECVEHLAAYRISVPTAYSLLSLYEAAASVNDLRVAVLRLCAELTGQGQDDAEERAAITSEPALVPCAKPDAVDKPVNKAVSKAVSNAPDTVVVAPPPEAKPPAAEPAETATQSASCVTASETASQMVSVTVVDDEWEFDDLEDEGGARAISAVAQAVPVEAVVVRSGDQIVRTTMVGGTNPGGNWRRDFEEIVDDVDASALERQPDVGEGIPEITLNADFREKVARFKAMIAKSNNNG